MLAGISQHLVAQQAPLKAAIIELVRIPSKARLQPNSSALIILGHVDDREAFLGKLRTFEPQVVMSTLSPEVEKELRARLGS